MKTSQDMNIVVGPRSRGWRPRSDGTHAGSTRFLQSLPRDARRACHRCLAEGVLTEADLAQADPATGTIPVTRHGVAGRLELLPFFAPGLMLGRVTTATGRFTVMISEHWGTYHAFAGVAGQAIQGTFATFAAAWEYALREGLRTEGQGLVGADLRVCPSAAGR